MKRKYKFIGLLIIVVLLTYYVRQGEEVRSSEDLAITIGVGYDLKSKVGDEVIYSDPVSFYEFKFDGTIKDKVRVGEGSFTFEARDDRQRKANKKFVQGLEKVYIFSEDVAKDGISNIVEGIFNSTIISDFGFVAVCKGKAQEMFEYHEEGYMSTPDYIEGLIKNLRFSYFFSDNFRMKDVFFRTLGEGRRVMLPYIEIKKEGIIVSSLAVFNEDKMVLKLDINEAKIMNLLSGTKGNGQLVLAENTYKFVGGSATAKRKVKVNKEGDKYKFTIDVTITQKIEYDKGDMKVLEDLKNQKIYKEKLSKEMENQGKEFISKMQNVYKMDLLELGRIAAAKYGRRTGVNWDEVVSNSIIDLNVNVKISTFGKGNY